MPWLALVVAGCRLAGGETAEPASPPRRVLRAAGFVDVRGGRLVPDAVLLVRGERIEAVGTAGEVRIPDGAEVLDLGRLVLVPGLIDAHTHLAWGPAVPEQPLPGAAEARLTLEAGFTTVRDLGSTARADLALQHAIETGELPGPRMQVAVAGIGPRGGVCDQVFAGGAVADTPEQAAERVRELVAAGAQVIKVCAGGGVLPSEAERETCECDQAVLERIVREAHALGLRVAAHAQGTAAIEHAVAAGVDSIEHGGLADEGVLGWMAEAGIPLVPTLSRLEALVEGAQRSGSSRAQIEALLRAQERARRSARAAVEAGVRIAFGTDATVMPHGTNAREFRALVEAGLTPAEALRSATLHAAELLGWEDRVGTLEPGRFADVVGVQGNPLEDIRVLERVRFVMKGGEVVVGPNP